MSANNYKCMLYAIFTSVNEHRLRGMQENANLDIAPTWLLYHCTELICKKWVWDRISLVKKKHDDPKKSSKVMSIVFPNDL